MTRGPTTNLNVLAGLGADFISSTPVAAEDHLQADLRKSVEVGKRRDTPKAYYAKLMDSFAKDEATRSSLRALNVMATRRRSNRQIKIRTPLVKQQEDARLVPPPVRRSSLDTNTLLRHGKAVPDRLDLGESDLSEMDGGATTFVEGPQMFGALSNEARELLESIRDKASIKIPVIHAPKHAIPRQATLEDVRKARAKAEKFLRKIMQLKNVWAQSELEHMTLMSILKDCLHSMDNEVHTLKHQISLTTLKLQTMKDNNRLLDQMTARLEAQKQSLDRILDAVAYHLSHSVSNLQNLRGKNTSHQTMMTTIKSLGSAQEVR